MDASSVDHVFVYGTLRRGFSNPGRRILDLHAERVGEGTVPGTLFDLGSFPALVEPETEGDRVRGEVYRLEREPKTALRRLDRYEGAAGPAPLPYERERRAVDVDSMEAPVDAWVYVWTGSIAHGERLPAGDYVAYLRGA